MYSEPEWSHATTKPSFLEVLKEGKIIGNIPIPQGTKFYTFGRLPENNVPLDHESTSRNHAVLQFGPRNAAFIYDLGSSHGTFVNKKQISPGQYVKIISGNAIIRFGASSRQYILNLEEYTDEEISPDSHECNDYRSIISSLFSEHVISLDRIECTQIRNITSCSLDFSEFISIDSSEPSRITSTGASKEEALDNFFEDSYNFFSRLGLISQRRNDNCSEYETDSDDSNENFYTVDDTNPKNSKPSNAPLSENEILNSRNQAKSKIESIQSELEASLKHLHELEREVVDDFDVYIQDLKKSECKKDIEKLEYMLDKAQKVKIYEKIINFDLFL